MFSKKLIFTAGCIGMSFFGISMITLGSILPFLSQKFGLDEIGASLPVTILPFGIILGSLIFGPVADRYGYKHLLITSSLVTISGIWILSFTNVFALLLFGIMLIGTGGGVLNGLTNAMVADISDENKNANLSLLGVFFGIGALGVPIVMGALSEKFSFESILGWLSVILLAFVLFFFFIKYPKPKQEQGFPIKDGLKLLKEPVLILLSFVLFFESGLEGLTNNWTTTFITKTSSLAQNEALFILTILVACMTGARLLLGVIMKKAKPEIVLYVSILIILAGIFMLKSATDFNNFAFAIGILGIGFAAVFPLVLGYIGSIYAHLSGTAFSIALVIALIGNMLLNYLMGNIAKLSGISQLSNILLISALIMGILLIVSINMNNKRKKIDA